MGEIKSSWEIASEKAARLGKLSPEEQQQQRENELRPVAHRLADSYLSSYSKSRAQDELNKYKDEDRELVRRIALRQLIEQIDLHSIHLLEKVKAGIEDLTTDKKAAGILNKIEELFNEYRQADEANRQEVEKAGRELLHQLRISGSAISKINSRARKEWRNKLNETATPFQRNLDNLKQELVKLK
jgi:hypothetical protein